MESFRVERDSLGEVRVPEGALYGAQTQRAVDNFPISGLGLPAAFIAAVALIKMHAAEVNGQLGLLPQEAATAIAAAAGEVVEGQHPDQFPVDVFQTGSGTSTNMNVNEVIATLAGRRLGRAVHPNDEVNLGQSSNDVIPTAMQVAACSAISERLLPTLRRLQDALTERSERFDPIVKSGRTHLMDATPVRLGQEFGGYAAQIGHSFVRVERSCADMAELPLGGTAVGTGVATHPQFAARVIERISASVGIGFREAGNHMERQSTRDTVVFAHGALNAAAVSLAKIANDLRLLASGPRTGLAEIVLPAVQPGSSIMPGKVNPVIPEAVTMVAAQVIGNQATITACGGGGILELNVMMPLMAERLLSSIELLSNASRVLADRCVVGIEADERRVRELLEGNLALGTALAPHIGYDAASKLAQRALAEGRTIRDVATESGVVAARDLDRILDVRAMTEPGIPGSPGESGT